MTAGSDKDGSSHYGTNHHAIHPRDDRETLSALFDGELSGDATRFALKRLITMPAGVRLAAAGN